MNNEEIKRRLARLESDRQVIQDTWDVIEKFVVPYRGEFFEDQKSENTIDWRARELFDSTAVMAAQTLASSIHGSLTSPATKWFDLRFRDDNLNLNKDAKAWLDEVAKIIYFALYDSNFDLEVSEVYLDLVSFGTACIVEEFEGDMLTGKDFKLNFKSIPVKEIFFEEDHKGGVCGLYRKLEWTAIQIVDKFGKEGVPADIFEKAENTSSSQTKMTVIYAITKRNFGNNKIEDDGGHLAPDKRPYEWKYILKQTGETLGEEGGYYEMPAFVPKWRVTSESQWGNSPAMVALPDIMTVNQLTELILRATEKVVDPATMVTERGLLSDLDLEAGGLSVVRSLDDIKVHESRARFDVSDLQREKLRESINHIFYVDQLELKESPSMTATEVQVRYELMQRLLGPTAGRIINNMLDPTIQRTFNGMMRAKQFPDMPDILKESSAELDIQYIGPLSRAQKVDQAAATERWLASVVGMAEMDPSVMEIPDFETIVRDMGDTLNIPAKYVKSKDKLNKERKDKQKAESDQSQLMQAQEGGAAMKAMGEGAQALQGAQSGEE